MPVAFTAAQLTCKSIDQPRLPGATSLLKPINSSHFGLEGALDGESSTDGKWCRMQQMVTKEPQLSMSPEKLRWNDHHWHRSFVYPGTSSTNSTTFAQLQSVKIPSCWPAAGNAAAAATTAAAPSCTAHVPHEVVP